MCYLLTEVLCNFSFPHVSGLPVEAFDSKWLSRLINLELTRRATDITGFLLAQDATVCSFFLLYRGAQMWLSSSCFFTLLIKILTFLIPVSPTANKQKNNKTRIYNRKITLQFFCPEMIVKFWSDTACTLLEEWIYTLSLKEQSQKGMRAFACLQCLHIFIRSEQSCHNRKEDPVL